MTDDVNDITQIADSISTENLDHLSSLVGDGKKYQDTNALAKAHVYASTHIDTLEDENKEIRVRERALHDIIKQIRNSDELVEDPKPLENQNTGANNVVDLDQVDRRVKQTLESERALEKAQSIQEQSFAKLHDEYGSKDVGLVKVAEIVKNNPSVRSIIDNLAETDSDAFIRFIKSYNTSNVPSQTQNTPGVLNVPSADAINTSDGSFTAEFARDLRKKNPKKYYSQDFQDRLFSSVERAMEKGQDFWTA